MGESATAVDAAQAKDKNIRFGLGKMGWGLWIFISLFNAMVVLGETPNATGVGYAIGIAVMAYLWIRFLKFAARKVRDFS